MIKKILFFLLFSLSLYSKEPVKNNIFVLSNLTEFSNIDLSSHDNRLIIVLEDGEYAILDFKKDYEEVVAQKVFFEKVIVSFDTMETGVYFLGIVHCDEYFDIVIIKK